MSFNFTINPLPTTMPTKRPYADLAKPFPTFRPYPTKRPRRILTPNSVISAVTDDNDSSSEPTVSPSPPPPYDPSVEHSSVEDSPQFDPCFNYQPHVIYSSEDSPLSPVFHPPTPPDSPPRSLRSDEDIQADVTNSFAAGQSGSLSWSNDLLVQVLANEVEDLIYSNEDRAHQVDAGEYQNFYSTFKQPFELDFYMRRLVQYVNCSTAVYVMMFVYLDRVQEKCKALLASDMNCHRLIFTCLVLAVKYLEDEVHSNGYYARVGGLTIDEMNSLEVKLLKVLDWNLSVSPETFAVYEEGMLQTAGLLLGGNQAYQVIVD